MFWTQIDFDIRDMSNYSWILFRKKKIFLAKLIFLIFGYYVTCVKSFCTYYCHEVTRTVHTMSSDQRLFFKRLANETMFVNFKNELIEGLSRQLWTLFEFVSNNQRYSNSKTRKTSLRVIKQQIHAVKNTWCHKQWLPAIISNTKSRITESQ